MQLNLGRQRESPCATFQEAAYQPLYQEDLWAVLSKYQTSEIKQSFPMRPYKSKVTRAPWWSCSPPALPSSHSGIQLQTWFRNTGNSIRYPAQSLSGVWLCDPTDCSMPGFPVLHHVLEFAQTHVHWVGDAIQPSHPVIHLVLLLSILPGIRVSSNESALCISWPKYWSFIQLWHQSFQWIFRVISFRIDWFDLPAVQGNLKKILPHHSSKASILWHSTSYLSIFLLS